MIMLAKSGAWGFAVLAVAMSGVLLGGCAQSPFHVPWTGTGVAAPTSLPGTAADPSATSAMAAAPAPVAGAPTAEAQNTPSGRAAHVAWNSAWAQSCGVYFDNQKLKTSYLNSEERAGMAPDQVAKISGLFDKAQAGFRTVAGNHADQCTPERLALIKATMARYLAGDFSPGQPV